VLAHRLDELERRLGADSPDLAEYQSILTAIRYLPDRYETDPERVAERQREKEIIKRRLAQLADANSHVRDFIAENVVLINGTPGEPHSFDLLDRLLAGQAYRLSYWRVAADEINYRRFFDVNELAALAMEKPEVFEGSHALIFRLLAEGALNGVRIDHPDGLYDPRQYLERLQEHFVLARARRLAESQPELAGRPWEEIQGSVRQRLRERGVERPLYVVVEKILTRDETLREDWPVYGTSGYDFLNLVNGLFVDPENRKALTRLYDDWLGEPLRFGEVAYQKKFLILRVSLSSELHVLARQFDRLAQKNRASRDFTLNSLRHALREIIACFPVYRSYISGEPIHPADRAYVQAAVARAKRRNPAISASLFDFVRDMLLLRDPIGASDEDQAEQRRFVGKFQQVTAPVMAKGVEDTAFYVYNRLLSLNEVGGDPDRFGVTPEALHRAFRDRQARWPWALSASSTHDTKRSEDVRARLNVLSEAPKEWGEALTRWAKLNERHRVALEDGPVPDANLEYFLYQTLLGAWPLEPYAPEEYQQFVARIQAYLVKAVHEAKVYTSWINPDAAYDEAVQTFASRVLDEANAEFLRDFRDFQRRLSHYGLFNSLAQTLVKITAPGAVDLYQGTELWDFSLVDPDNRRPVDYERRRHLLQELQDEVGGAGAELAARVRRLVDTKEDGRIKLYLIYQALRCRRAYPRLFATGEYLPAEVTGAAREHVFGFTRRQEGGRAVVAVPRLLTTLVPPGGVPLGAAIWRDTALIVPGIAPGQRCRHVFTGATIRAGDDQGQGALPLAEVFADFPVALLVAQD
jgi:(1->4)-alpha-D-glucan 1-alpha-D-glucosylmutase